jgi:hypothetical protein
VISVMATLSIAVGVVDVDVGRKVAEEVVEYPAVVLLLIGLLE